MPVRQTATRLMLTGAILMSALLWGCTGEAGDRTQSDYDKAYRIGLQAYRYGLPLLVTDATYRTMTSVNVSQGAFGPVNQFNNVRGVNNAGSKAVVAPGSTGLSSIAWLDLADEPQVLHVPDVTDHFFVLALIDPYTENIKNFGQASGTTPGDYVIAGPGHHDVAAPEGTQKVNVDYSRIWIIGSTQLKGPKDIPAVNEIQDGYTLTPLSAYEPGKAYAVPEPSHPETTVVDHTVPSGVEFFDALGEQLALFPPPAADEKALRSFATVGIGPGKAPSRDSSLSSETVRGLSDAVAAGPKLIKQDTQAVVKQDAPSHQGYLLGGFGTYGTDYRLRAVISQIGLGAFVPQQAIYAMAWNDAAGAQLDGSRAYVLHMPEAPPTRQGWSLTVYDLHGALVPNSLNRYAFSSTSDLVKNADGSVDFYLQSTEPTAPARAANWLPTPKDQGFEVTWRLFAPMSDKIEGVLAGDGWQPPAIEPAP